MDRGGTLQKARRDYIQKVLAHTKGDLEQASRILGISPATLRGLLREMKASPDADRDQGNSQLKQGYEYDQES